MNLENSDFRWDYDDCLDQDNINKSFVYTLLGETTTGKTLALVMAPVEDGKFMRIGIFFNFKLKARVLDEEKNNDHLSDEDICAIILIAWENVIILVRGAHLFDYP
jgi:hypothetical protein